MSSSAAPEPSAASAARVVFVTAPDLARHHPYEVPECVALEPASVAPAYLAWLLAACAERAEG